jgi:hypothetical protein
MTTLKPFAFVLMPFAKEFDDIYKLGIQAAAKDFGIVAERVDEQIFSETMLERIYRQIDAADFIIADMTGRNPNVFYEVGYAHAKGKLCTLLTQTSDDIPFDLKHHRHLVYRNSIQTLRELLSNELVWLKGESERRGATTISAELRYGTTFLSKNEYTARGEIEFIFDLSNHSGRRSPDIEAIYFYTGKGWTFEQGSDTCPSAESKVAPFNVRHFLKPPVPRLASGAWAQITIKGSKSLWSKYRGDSPVEDSYRVAGNSILEIVTSEGTFHHKFTVDVVVDEFPF